MSDILEKDWVRLRLMVATAQDESHHLGNDRRSKAFQRVLEWMEGMEDLRQSAPEVVLPCPNCGEELYDSITLSWGDNVPRCPRCAADQRSPIPSIEEQMVERGVLRRFESVSDT